MELRHFIHEQDFTKEELLAIMELTWALKAADRDGACPRILQDASLGMIFEEPSTRTRISFEVAMTELGGHALYLKPGEIHLGVRENIADTAAVISRMVDIVMIRALKHKTVTNFAQYATVPVVNGLTDFNHPTQAVCDVLTMLEHKPAEKRPEDVRITFIGDATNVCSSLMFTTTKMGMHFTQAAPQKYQAPQAWQQAAQANCQISGGSLTITDDPLAAVKEADFIYTDLWWWVGQEDQIPERRAAFMPRYQVNMDLISQAPAHCKFMHCLPASRGVEVTDEVMDCERSIIYDQSENRLHVEKGLLVYFLYPRLKQPSEVLKAQHRDRIEALLGNVNKI